MGYDCWRHLAEHLTVVALDVDGILLETRHVYPHRHVHSIFSAVVRSTRSQMACPQRSYGGRGLLAYLGRLLFAFWLLEAGLRTFPVFALARSGLLR